MKNRARISPCLRMYSTSAACRTGLIVTQDQARFSSRHLQERPLWQISSPDRDVVSFVKAQSHQSTGRRVGPLIVVLVGPADIECLTEFRITRVYKGFPVGKGFSLTV